MLFMMKRRLSFVLVFFTSLIFAQEIPVHRTKTYSYALNKNSLIYDKETESKINFQDLNELLKKYPNADLEVKEEDINGYALSYYFIKEPNKKNLDTKPIHVEINRNDVKGNSFNLETINSKYTLIILQQDLEFPRINIEDIKEAEFAAIKRGYTSVILSESDLNQAKIFTKEQGLNSVIIPNARNLINGFNSKRFPLYIILDANKYIISSLKYSYEVEDELLVLD